MTYTGVKIKFCGMTRLVDAALAESLGVDFIGFIFDQSSPRYISPANAARIVRQLTGKAHRVGVFVNAPVGEVKRIAASVPLDIVQLHGDEDAMYVRDLSVPVIRVARTRGDLATASQCPELEAVLVDGFHPEKRGGTGILFDPEVAKNAAEKHPVILAGGLNSENVQSHIEKTKHRLYGVDVSGGIELSPGKKDPQKMIRFIEAVRSAHVGV